MKIYLIVITITITLMLITAGPGKCSRESSGETLRAEEIIGSIIKQNKKLNDFSADFNARVFFLFMELPVNGKIYFKQPDKLRVKFNNIPDLLKNQKDAFKSVVPKAEKYNPGLCRLIRIEKKNEKEFYLIGVKPENQQNLKETFLWINTKTMQPDYIILEYKDKSSIEVENEFTDKFDFSLPESQKVQFKLPAFKGKARIIYKNYRVNKGIPDSVFK